MKRRHHLAILAFVLLMSTGLRAQGTPTAPPAPPPAQQPWAYSLTTDGYIAPKGQSYVSPVLTADHNWLHLEARYNYEDQRTGSLWAGYNFSAGKKLQFAVTPMIGQRSLFRRMRTAPRIIVRTRAIASHAGGSGTRSAGS